MAESDGRQNLSQWRAAASPGGLVGLLLIILSIFAMGGATLGIVGRADVPLPDAFLWVVLALGLIAALLCGFLLWGYLSIRYELDSQHIRVRWAKRTHTIFLDDILFIGPVAEHGGRQNQGWRPFWPGYYMSTTRSATGSLRTIATLPTRRQVLIVLRQGEQYAISPERPILFLEEYDRLRRNLDRERPDLLDVPVQVNPAQRLIDAGWTGEHVAVGAAVPAEPAAPTVPSIAPIERPPVPQPSQPTRVVRVKPSSTSPLLRPIVLSDPIGMGLLVLGVLTTAAMVVYIFVRFQDVPPSITLHWTVEGLPGRVGTAQEIWILPTICGLVLVANFGLAWSIALFDRFAARFLLGSTILVHVVAWVALMMLIG